MPGFPHLRAAERRGNSVSNAAEGGRARVRKDDAERATCLGTRGCAADGGRSTTASADSLPSLLAVTSPWDEVARPRQVADAAPRGGQDGSLSPYPYERTRMIVFPLRRAVGLRAATAS